MIEGEIAATNLDSLKTKMKSLSQPVVNPFVHSIKLTTMQKIQVALMSVTLAPLRLLLFGLSLVVLWIFAYLFSIGMPAQAKRPSSPIRQALCNSLRIMARWGLFFLGFHWLQVRGKRVSSREAPFLIAAPHSTMLDVIVAFVTDPLPTVVSRIENYQTPLFGTLVRAMRPVLVSRKDSTSRRRGIDDIKERVSQAGKWPQILIFSEGTCSNRKSLITFKAGAFIPGVPVQPVVVEYLNGLDTFSWTMDGPGAWKLLWLTACQFQIKFRINYLPVYKPDEMEKENPRLYANNVRAFMAKALDVPCTDHSFEDCCLMQHAASLNLPMEAGLVEFTKLNKELGLTIDILKDRLSEFSHIAPERKDGKINVEDLAKFLKLPVPVTEAFQNLFNFYDQDQNGLLDFRQYVIGWSLIAEATATGMTVAGIGTLACRVFGENKDGVLSEEKFVHAMETALNYEIYGGELFKEIQKSNSDRVTSDEFCNYIKLRPEYFQLFVGQNEMKQDRNDIDVNLPSFDFSSNFVTQRKTARNVEIEYVS